MSSTPDTQTVLNVDTVLDALNYWQQAAGITYVLLPADTPPRLLLRTGTDGLGTMALSRGGIDGTIAGTSQVVSGLVVILPAVAANCPPDASQCRALFRHEVGHALGFLGEPPGTDLMSAEPGTDVASDEDLRMMSALYSLPIGARLSDDGSWTVDATGQSGQLTDSLAVQDILTYNVRTDTDAAFRTPGLISRWQPPVPVYFQR